MDKNIYTEYKETISVRTCMMMSKPNPEETRMGNDTHTHTPWTGRIYRIDWDTICR